MSDSYLAELWAAKQPPWNTLGPEIAAAITRDASQRAVIARLVSWAHALQRARGIRGMTQREVAAKTGVSQERISNAERSIIGPNSSTWATLAAFYGIVLE